FNNSIYTTLGISPNKVVYGFKPQSILDILEAAKLINEASIIVKRRYNTKYTPIQFEVGDIIYIRLYRIIRKVKYLAYKLDFLRNLKLYYIILVI
ncbi:hypothetical protein GE21DRAFT_1209023, partial [Neurospora crassa]